MTMSSPTPPIPRLHVWSCAGLLVLLMSGCATRPPTDSSTEQPFDKAVAAATDSLVGQTQKLPTFLAGMKPKNGVVVDPMIDAGSAQQTVATQQLQDVVATRLNAKFDSIELLQFQSANLVKARYLLTGTMTRTSTAEPHAPLRIDLALTELASGYVVAHSSALASDQGLDHTPLPYYRDAPTPTRDPVVEAYVRTTATAPGQKADPYYLGHLNDAPAIVDANALYNAERYQDALDRYVTTISSPNGEQLRVLNGIYLTSTKLGRTAEAEQAFGKIVAYGIANQQLGVKFLFTPGSTVFWPEARISGPYAMWLREIAKASTDAKVCMNIVGHTSHTGSASYNDSLSLQRAVYIRQRLLVESKALGDRTKTSGMGFRENIVGSGTDDAADALDRRVEFKIINCQPTEAANSVRGSRS